MWVATQKRQVNTHASVKSKSEKFAPLYENAAVSFSVHPHTRQPYIEVKGTSPRTASRSHAAPSYSSRSGPQPPASMVGGKKQEEEDPHLALAHVS
ncbi:unnamed protein product [Sphagnum jensenii]|uniref:Uncharacterized protein n=1 Tax=Sphagnum jensenii TaxID=128206 RepID=A0ABP1A3Y2_9BRYO